jgi:YfiH family protein
MVGRADAGRGWEARETEVAETDALVTRERGLSLGILVADCAPVAIVPPEGGLAAAHAGWRGLVSGVLEAAVEALESSGAGPRERYQVWVGPCIRGCCYEVGEEAWSQFPESCLAPALHSSARRLDLQEAVVHRLRQAGLLPAKTVALGLCTACHPELFFSHRRATRQGLPTTGRMALFARL